MTKAPGIESQVLTTHLGCCVTVGDATIEKPLTAKTNLYSLSSAQRGRIVEWKNLKVGGKPPDEFDQPGVLKSLNIGTPPYK